MGLILKRLAFSLLLAAALVAIASAALYVTEARPIVSLLIEPVSLFLLPGLLIAIAAAGAHDFSAQSVLVLSFLIYAFLFFLLLRRRASARAAHTSR